MPCSLITVTVIGVSPRAQDLSSHRFLTFLTMSGTGYVSWSRPSFIHMNIFIIAILESLSYASVKLLFLRVWVPVSGERILSYLMFVMESMQLDICGVSLV